MINIHLSRAEALHIIELLNKAHDSLTQSLLIAVEDENAKDEVVRAAKLNYVSNLETEVARLQEQADSINKTKEIAPYGLKKDGTPKARPGRKVATRKTKGKK